MINRDHKTQSGLTNIEVIKRRKQFGRNAITGKTTSPLEIFIRQFKNIFNIILIVASVIALFTGDVTNSLIIILIIFVSGILGFVNEYKADKSVKELSKKVKFHITVRRNGVKEEIDSTDLVPDDLVYVENGSIVPADMVLLESFYLQVDESVLTGESFPVNKDEKNNKLMMGTTVINGYAWGKVINTGMSTDYGKIAGLIERKEMPTTFERGITSFSSLVFQIIVVMAFIIFISNVLLKHDFLDALLFSLAIAIGLTPELLPAIITISLTTGMRNLLKKKVIVKHLTVIENFGNIDIICTDKTGTLTEGKIQLSELFSNSKNKEDLLKYSLACNEAVLYPKISGNNIDVAIWNYAQDKGIKELPDNIKTIKEFPFNFEKRIMFAVVNYKEELLLVLKGAPEEVFSMCKKDKDFEGYQKKFHEFVDDGKRIIAVAMMKIKSADVNVDKEKDFELCGLISFLDNPKESAKRSLQKFAKLGIEIKILTGDNLLVTEHICRLMNLPIKGMTNGDDLFKLSNNEQIEKIKNTTIFAKVSPSQKSEIIKILRSLDLTVGFLGDGINDAASIKMADVGISVDTAVDIAKDAADVVLMNKDLEVLSNGIIEGRKTFENTIKYLLMNVSTNFGDMFTMTIASFFLPFLPLLPIQVLLSNLLWDGSMLSITTDNVKNEDLKRPDQWNIRFITKFMLFFGPIATVFDFITFFVLFKIFDANEVFMHTGWFLESLVTDLVIVFVIRTRVVPFFKSRPSWQLFTTIIITLIAAFVITQTVIGASLGFMTLPLGYFLFLGIATVLYITVIEVGKMWFYRRLEKKDER